jgi:hypothetical protein
MVSNNLRITTVVYFPMGPILWTSSLQTLHLQVEADHGRCGEKGKYEFSQVSFLWVVEREQQSEAGNVAGVQKSFSFLGWLMRSKLTGDPTSPALAHSKDPTRDPCCGESPHLCPEGSAGRPGEPLFLLRL